MSILIEGFITTASPLNVASPEKGSAGDPKAIMKTKVVDGNTIDRVPYFPGNGLRGRMRRQAARFVMPSIIEKKGEKLSETLYLGLLSGTAFAAPNSEGSSLKDVIDAQSNTFLGLFGGGPNLFKSGMQVSDLIPVLPSTVKCGAIPSSIFEESHFVGKITPPSSMYSNDKDGNAQPRRGYMITDNWMFVHLDDMNRSLDARLAEQNLKDYEVQIAAYAVKVQQNSSQRKDDDETKKNDLSNFQQVEMIPRGVDMYSRISFDSTITKDQVGLALWALLGVVNEQKLGGWTRIGFGRFVPNLVLRDGENTFAIFEQTSEGIYKFTNEVAEYLQAAQEAVQSMDVAKLQNLYASTSKPKVEKPKKEKKGAKEDSTEETEAAETSGE